MSQIYELNSGIHPRTIMQYGSFKKKKRSKLMNYAPKFTTSPNYAPKSAMSPNYAPEFSMSTR